MTAVPIGLRLHPRVLLRSQATRGDAAAFAAVYERHHQALYRYCRSILRHEEDAQDALQNTMARAFAALQDEHRDFELRPWLFRIAHNEAISILRQRRATAEFDDEQSAPSAKLEDLVAVREELRLLQLDLADLPERQRAALVLRELCGLSHGDIGAVLELSPVAVKRAIFDARNALFSSREGREFACDDVRRKLSDGDGRVLRGRGVRSHVRSCAGCRRFQADLAQRPQVLRMLAPPLPTAGAAMLLSQVLGATAAKVLACILIVGGGTTFAVETRHAQEHAQADAGKHRSAPLPQAVPAPAASNPVASARIPSLVLQSSTDGLARRERSEARPRTSTPVSHPVAPPGEATEDAGRGSSAAPSAVREVEPAPSEERGGQARDVPTGTSPQPEPTSEASRREGGGNRGIPEDHGANGAGRGKAESHGHGVNRGNAEGRGDGTERSTAERSGHAESVADAASRRKSATPGVAGKTTEASSPPAADTATDRGPPPGTNPAAAEPPAQQRDGIPPPAAAAHAPAGTDPRGAPVKSRDRAGG